MKKSILTTLAAAATLATSGAATTILIDYNDGVSGGGHDAAVRNGGFETNSRPGDASYNGGANWTNNGTATSATDLYNAAARTGTSTGIVSGASIPTNNTGHIIALGDVINLTFWAKSNNATSRVISWHLGGFNATFTDFSSGGSASVTATGTYQMFSGSKTVGTGDALIGQSLALQFRRVDSAGFPTVDDVTLTVVPEPSAAALLGLSGLALILRRRK